MQASSEVGLQHSYGTWDEQVRVKAMHIIILCREKVIMRGPFPYKTIMACKLPSFQAETLFTVQGVEHVFDALHNEKEIVYIFQINNRNTMCYIIPIYRIIKLT